MEHSASAAFPLFIDQNEIHLYYRLPSLGFDHPKNITLGQIAKCQRDHQLDCMPPCPSDQLPALEVRYPKTEVWRRVDETKKGISSDLNPALRELLEGQHPELLQRWKLSELANRFLSRFDLFQESDSVESRAAREMRLIWSKAAAERLQEAGASTAPPVIKVNDLMLWIMGTGVAFAELSITLEAEHTLTGSELTEAVAALSRFNKIQWFRKGSDTPDCKNEATLGAVVRSLVFGHADAETPRRRVPTYTFARLAEPAPIALVEKTAAYLSRRYTSAYDFDLESKQLHFLRNFGNIRHVISEEGAATLIVPDADGKVPQYLENFGSSALRSAYSPIALAAWHEQSFLTKGRAQTLEAKSEDASLDELNGIIDDALLFRLYFRHTHFSDISMHNEFGEAFRSALKLDKKLVDLQQDVNAVHAKIVDARQAAEHKEEQSKYRRYYWISVVGGAALAGLTTYTICKEVGVLALYPDKTTAGWLAVAAGATVMIAAAILGFMRRPKKPKHGHHDGHLTLHAMQEHMIKRALQ
ncbi:hypothetical protein ACFQ14_01130 [Pseudahrensia aquimaris]|uniref:Uncharacterized protein n=1 Tax=Pseudahrensia aquimaris TaxID=744461 RepID=A0ABW3FAU8_9HYPH